jgi:alpha/beta superfamily hydrolase
VKDERVTGLVGLGIPIRNLNYDFDFLGETSKPTLIVQGESDEFGSGEDVAAVLAPLGSHISLVRIAGSDHYFDDRLDELRSAVRDYFEAGPGAAVLAGA